MSWTIKKYPDNPNGSIDDIAAITNSKGNVLAMMPHPERAMYYYNMPDWLNSQKKIKKSKIMERKKMHIDGYKIFKNVYYYFK